MKFVVAVFRSRTETITFSNLLKSYGVPTYIISTPRNLNVSCGISAKFPMQFQSIAADIIARRKFNTFGGFHIMN